MNSSCCCELRIQLNEYPSFKLENAVCNHGFFMMAPNIWNPSTQCFSRPLRLADSTTSINVTISQSSHENCLIVKLDHVKKITSLDKKAILGQVQRMLRLSLEDEKHVQEFQKIHPEAKEKGFGRIFRSPSLFEDAIKCFLLCYCRFQNTLKMAELLCDIQFELLNGLITGKDNMILLNSNQGIKRKRNDDDSSMNTHLRNFPNAKELCCFDEDFLKKRGKTGLRSRYILEFARKVDSGEYKLREFEKCTSHIKLCQKLKEIKGFGKYAAANMKMCLGFYTIVPIDSETKRHFEEIHGRSSCSSEVIKEIYGKYAPFQCLAFWFELLAYYENSRHASFHTVDFNNKHLNKIEENIMPPPPETAPSKNSSELLPDSECGGNPHHVLEGGPSRDEDIQLVDVDVTMEGKANELLLFGLFLKRLVINLDVKFVNKNSHIREAVTPIYLQDI
ncbi:hypothetical protein M9H77_29513 [Catharanthus roseus]|uniref:Uncharacterized protein n=1 Tax=Catharanthus roseus TaxID=4058 RepID=A0ACB9ZVI5_CATRO|nr:hypothetical protein M9H77_29513 [Catharanthus roseus]